ncbi:Aldolase-type TIM barrel,Orotidine 5'-phosphate decarboxylase domain,Orotidine 5'-phosphate decarboxylase [Cinara cedri]|uniref:Orotidine 5'-phosphate decarboxylase n=1 Tax=Cinara cedri TaxID=506608 RepID=A0A5E4N7J6_9HEMI|nr:Aldolase-type TIM barrel,Orotidine 5'-phosphate decarboxylase domain,Orotidine 5'-phosphate decarboxylase [Cinara cedri]
MSVVNPIICAIDTQNINKAISLANILHGKVGMIKLGLEFFAAHGLFGVREITKCDIPIFLDIKLHDIPNTVARTVTVIKDLNVAMLTLHITGGAKMLKEALSAAQGTKMKLVGVTVLTSMDNKDLHESGIEKEVVSQVTLLAKLAKESGLQGIVCSALEAQEVRQKCGKDCNIITPGIRINSSNDDQKRITTPREAIALGADYLVLGRPITNSIDPAKTAKLILDSLKRDH